MEAERRRITIFSLSSPGHESVRLIEIPDKGLWCPLGCGPSIPATRIVNHTMKTKKKPKPRKKLHYINGLHS